MNRIILTITLLFFLNMQNYSQWQKTSLQTTVKINTLAISGLNIYAGTNGDGIFESTDNGENWDNRNDGLQSKVIYTLLINGTTIFAGTATGVSISLNNGLNWETINSGLPEEPVTSIALDNSSGLFAGTWKGVYSSTNNGTNWSATDLTTTMPVNSIAVFNSIVFVSTYAGGIFRTENRGNTWTDISIWIIEYDSWTGLEISRRLVPVYSLNSIGNNVIVGAGYNGGIYYSPYYFPNFSHSTISAQYSPVLCFAFHDTNLYGANAIGDIFKSDPDGLTWKLLPTSLTNIAIYSLALSDSYIFAGTENGIWRLKYPKGITIVDNIEKIPASFVLEQNYPNPFNASTKIKFSIPTNGWVSLKVYNIVGEMVDNLIDKYMAQGTYEVDFSPDGLESGVFFYTLITKEFTSTKKLILLK